MGTMILQFPADLRDAAQAELERACVLGGQDNMPYQTQAILDGGQLMLHRPIAESGSILVPWEVPGAGQVMVASGSLMERLAPYHLLLELARGKINQVRNQTSDWLLGGLVMPEGLDQAIRTATQAFSKAATHYPDPAFVPEAQQALERSFHAADMLVHAYMNQVFQVRHQRQPKLETFLGCRVYPGAGPPKPEAAFCESFNTLCLPVTWSIVQPREDSLDWSSCDELIAWAAQQRLNVVGGPLVDFSGRGLPDWLWEKDTDLASLCGYLTDYVETVIQRYHGKIRTWQISAGSNTAGVLALADEELLWLTVRLVEAARRVDPNLELIVGVAQPFGDYLAQQERNQSPFAFADTLLRTGLRLGGLELELVMGVQPRGSYCRDLLDVSRLLDLYALLGLPIHMTLGYPAASTPDLNSDSDLRTGAGYWRGGFAPDAQADWTDQFATLAICKPFVRAATWTHWNDVAYHQFPNCGVVAGETPRPALSRLQALRVAHLK